MQNLPRSAPALGLAALSFLAALATLASFASGQAVTETLRLDLEDLDDYYEAGRAIAVTGDTVFIGTRGDDTISPGAGGVRVLERQGDGSWAATQTLYGSTLEFGSAFGIRLVADGERAAVGSLSGRVYVFERDGATGLWSETAILSPPVSAGSSAFFSEGLALDGDRIVVGAPQADVAGEDTGAAYVFDFNPFSQSWVLAAELVHFDPELDDWFGESVAVDGDTVVVGCYQDDGAAIDDTGSVLVYERDQGGAGAWGLVVQIEPFDPGLLLLFSRFAIGLDGDTLLVGSNKQPNGAAYVYERDRGGPNAWGLVTQLAPTDLSGPALFGTALDVEGDVAVIGAQWDSVFAQTGGTVRVYHRDLGGTDAWGAVATLAPSDPLASDLFGAELDFDAGRIVVASPWRAEVGIRAGAAYLFDVFRPASVARNGSGTNPLVLQATTGPVLGASWSATVDTSAYPSAATTLLVGTLAPLDGIPVAGGELLIDLASGVAFTDTAVPLGGAATHTLAVPADPALLGGTFALQSAVLGGIFGGGLVLTNALDVVVGG